VSRCRNRSLPETAAISTGSLKVTLIRVSLSPEGKRGGDLGFFSKGDMPKEFEDVVFDLPLQTISGVVKTVYGYHVFRVEEKRSAMDLRFSEVKDQIINKLKREKGDMEFRTWMKELKQKTRIEVREELL